MIKRLNSVLGGWATVNSRSMMPAGVSIDRTLKACSHKRKYTTQKNV
jgi:hypothetical protein